MINEAEYKLLPRELLTKMVELRLQEEDCNAGCIFDNLTSELWPDEKFAINFISDAIPRQNVQVLLFNFKKETAEFNDEQVDMEVCTNYRFANRHDSSLAQRRQAKKDEGNQQQKESGEGKTPRAKKEP